MADLEIRQFKRILKTNKYFLTAPRMRLFGLLQQRPALTMQQLVQASRATDRATVYRNIDLFEKLGVVTKIQHGWQTKVELSDMFKHHHHHMTCIKCRKVYVLKDNDVVEAEIARIARASRFKPTDHSLEIRGLCPACQD